MDFKETLAKFARPALRPHEQAVNAALEAGRQAKFAENYDKAIADLESALQLASAAQDQPAEIAALLHKTEIWMRQERYAEAQRLLQEILERTNSAGQRSYTYTMIGMVAQSQGDWVGARSAYEQALADARTDAVAAAEGRALGRLADTYLHDLNASYAVHLLRDALAKLESAGDSEPTSYFNGLLGQALIQNGQEGEGQQLLDRALRIAEQQGYRGYERHWALVLGDRALQEGRYQDAHVYYNHVLRLFTPESVAPEYVIAVGQMSRACMGLHKPDEALAYAQVALKTAEQIGDPQLKQQAQGALGIALRALGHSDDAIPHLQAAASEGAQADVLRSLAVAQADSGDTDGAISTYQRAIKQAESGGKALELAQSRRDLGLVYQRRKDYQAAVNEWSAALLIYDSQRAYAQLARLYCDIGSARKQLGQRARAMRDYEQALMVLNSITDGDQETRGLVLSNAANAYAEQGDVESADAFFTEAIAIAERLGNRVAESTRSGNYGWFLLLVGRPRRAIATLERALAISQPLNLKLQAAVQLDNLGLVHDSLGDFPAALDQHRKALALISDLAEPSWAAQIKINLANSLISTEQYAEAQTLLDEALAYGRASAQGEVTIAALIAMVRSRIARQQPAEAEDVLVEVLALARKLDQRRLLAEALTVRSQQQAALTRADDSAAAWEEAQKLYAMLHMPQAKLHPLWLTPSTTRP